MCSVFQQLELLITDTLCYTVFYYIVSHCLSLTGGIKVIIQNTVF